LRLAHTGYHDIAEYHRAFRCEPHESYENKPNNLGKETDEANESNPARLLHNYRSSKANKQHIPKMHDCHGGLFLSVGGLVSQIRRELLHLLVKPHAAVVLGLVGERIGLRVLAVEVESEVAGAVALRAGSLALPTRSRR